MKIEYRTLNITLPSASKSIDANISLPDGIVKAIGVVSQGNTAGDIIDFSVLDNSNDVISPSDLRFSEPKSAGRFLESLRPVEFSAGKTFGVKLNAVNATRANDVVVQVLFAIVSKC